MNYKVLYRKYRPSNFDEVVGQKNTIRLLSESIINNKLSHAYIFSGPRGTGKTSCAKIFAKTINCLDNTSGLACGKCTNCMEFSTSSDIYEIDAASNNGVDQIREIIDNIKLAPINSKYKVYIIDEVHMLSQSAFNALLLTLEEPPAHVVFILATTNIENVPITILSRCQRLDFKKISTIDMIERLKYISSQESIDITDEAINEICEYADGGLRDALSILDQLSKSGEKITDLDVLNSLGSISKKEIIDTIDALEASNVENIITFIEKCRNSSADFKTIIRRFIDCIKERAIKIKNGTFKTNIGFDSYKNLCFELVECLSKASISVDSYVLIELILLNYINLSDNVESNNNKSLNDKKTESGKIVDAPKKTEITKTETMETTKYSKLVEIRLNNCFAQATKSDKMHVSENWNQFVQSIDSKKLKGDLIDCQVVLASQRIIVLSTLTDVSSNSINDNLEEISQIYSNSFNKEFKFVCISERRWKKAMEEYKFNLQNGRKYELIDESESYNEDNDINILEDVFINDKIEIV